MRFLKQLSYFLVGAVLVGLAGTVVMSRSALARQMDQWRLLPRPERFTELYFTNTQLPTSMKPGVAQNVAFTVHNLEHQATGYRYSIMAVPEGSGSEREVGNGAFTLGHDESKVLVEAALIPPTSARMGIKVLLSHEGPTPEDRTPHLQQQSIQYWLNVMSVASKKPGVHAVK